MINYNEAVNDGKHRGDNIELSLPINPAYVSAARLTASSIANRIGFDIDEIEDVKAAVSEACTYIIKKAPSKEMSLFKIMFVIEGDVMNIALECAQKFPISDVAGEMGLMMIKALMDEMTINDAGDGVFSIRMIKTHKESVFK